MHFELTTIVLQQNIFTFSELAYTNFEVSLFAKCPDETEPKI